MNILLTGATGNLGMSALRELLRQGHRVRCFVRRPKALERWAASDASDQVTRIPRPHSPLQNRHDFLRDHHRVSAGGSIEVVQGDMRRPADLAKVMQDVDVIIHLAYMIPPGSEDHSELARSINVDGTRHLLAAASRQPRPPRVLFASSFDVFGHTQDQPPPRKVTDPVQATDHYTAHKIACEEMVRTSGLQWTIFRFADIPPLGLRSPHPIMFRIPLSTRFEVIHPYDAGLAIANGICSHEVWGRTLLIGGGPGCQILYRDYLGRMLEMMGIGMLPERAFGTSPYSTDWLDTEESQRLLHYQRYSFDDIMEQLTRIVGYKRLLTALVRPAARWWILRMSPYYKA